MAEVLVFHHGHGLTAGIREFAEHLRRAGHTVHIPDLYEGWVFDSLHEGSDTLQSRSIIECSPSSSASIRGINGLMSG
ncbi:hypothetical protein ACFYOY_44120 [Streptomyces sp. NPDC007875]|uniref:hypothetical protein n=1 Tax=Streptomyces sp. NPDC007875 TaxID=3364783 RepID=UPI0036941C46